FQPVDPGKVGRPHPAPYAKQRLGRIAQAGHPPGQSNSLQSAHTKSWLIEAVDSQPDNTALPPFNNIVVVREQLMLAERPPAARSAIEDRAEIPVPALPFRS